MQNDDLGERMKAYEGVPKTTLVPKVPVLMRLDGKAFHTFTRGLERPYCRWFHCCMWEAASYLCKNIQGCQIAYVQSDEITLLLTDYQTLKTDPWYGYQVQKMCSVAAAMAAVAFLRQYISYMPDGFVQVVDAISDDNTHGMMLPHNRLLELALPAFDCRVWNLPKEEVVNAFVWRQQDATRNAIQMLGQSKFSHKQLHGASCEQIQEMLHQQHGVNFNDCPVPQKRGVCIVKETYNAQKVGIFGAPGEDGVSHFVRRHRWVVDEDIPVFTKDRNYIERHVHPQEVESTYLGIDTAPARRIDLTPEASAELTELLKNK